jgi:hypothetical protein
MVYGSSEEVPGGHGQRRREVESSDVERARIDVFLAAEKCGLLFEDGDDAAALLRIAKWLNGYGFTMGAAIWDFRPAALLRAWDALTDVDTEAEAIGDAAAECPF